MFGLIADLLTSVVTVLFPIFASYKALRTTDPAQLSPWLMYFVIISLTTLFESLTYPILGWVPFYSWFRLILHTYLLLPGSQGATLIYQTYLHPFLYKHESEIERMISDSHDKAKAAGLQYVEQLLEYVKVHVLGMQPRRPISPANTQNTYAQNLLARFNLPTAREGFAAPATDLYSMFSSALQQATFSAGTGREAHTSKVEVNASIFPPGVASEADRLEYISSQREKLRVLLRAFDKEVDSLAYGSLPPQGSTEGLTKSKSELDFDNISSEDVGSDKVDRLPSGTAGGWMPWNWRGSGAQPSGAGKESGTHASVSTGVDLGH